MKDFKAEQLLGSDGIDIRNREPLIVLIPESTRGEAVTVADLTQLEYKNIPKDIYQLGTVSK